jgi:hypothetical protein
MLNMAISTRLYAINEVLPLSNQEQHENVVALSENDVESGLLQHNNNHNHAPYAFHSQPSTCVKVIGGTGFVVLLTFMGAYVGLH